jgi:hypothetical protein
LTAIRQQGDDIAAREGVGVLHEIPEKGRYSLTFSELSREGTML